MRSGTATTGTTAVVQEGWEREAPTRSKRPCAAPAGLFERAVQLAQALGLDWSGAGAGVYRCELDHGQSVWRAHSDWGGTGTIVDIDVRGELILQVQAREIDHVGCGLRLPEHLQPSEAEVLAFVRAKLDVLAWPWPPLLFAHWDAAACSWRVRGESVAHHCGFQAEVHGMRDKLCLARMWRV